MFFIYCIYFLPETSNNQDHPKILTARCRKPDNRQRKIIMNDLEDRHTGDEGIVRKIFPSVKGQSHEICRVILLHGWTYLHWEKNRCCFLKF
jgi:hypothetical protein